jgi:hypothetical protein
MLFGNKTHVRLYENRIGMLSNHLQGVMWLLSGRIRNGLVFNAGLASLSLGSVSGPSMSEALDDWMGKDGGPETGRVNVISSLNKNRARSCPVHEYKS